MRTMKSMAAGAALFSFSAPFAAAEEAWRCKALQECKNTADDCRTLDLDFRVTLAGTPQTLRMAAPGQGDLMLGMTKSSPDFRVFAADQGEVNYTATLHGDGRFFAKLSETMFWGGVIENTLTAICRRDLA